MNEIIARKKQGKRLSEEEIRRFVAGVTDNSIPDYQTTALLMAICWRGMDIEERTYLTEAMAQSGTKLNFRKVDGIKTDKHSTGGVGDKISLMLAPWLAAAGRKVPMISGRGLGFTGGTLDKLAAIPGYKIDFTQKELTTFLNKVGCFVIGQTQDIAPADRKIYALRDVTATVDEISLITASILSKKLTEDLDVLVMDVKCGTGAFMQNLKDARSLAKSIADTANKAGVRTVSLVTAMDFPLGRYTGNTAETWEAYYFCRKDSQYRRVAEKLYTTKEILTAEEAILKSVVEITVELAVLLLNPDAIKDKAKRLRAIETLLSLWESGALEKKFSEWIKAQHGDEKAFLGKAHKIQNAFDKNSKQEIIWVFAPKDGYLANADSRALGNLMVDLGAGRKKSTDTIDDRVTLEVCKAPGEYVKKGDAIIRIYKPNVSKNEKEKIEKIGQSAFTISPKKQKAFINILERI
ncbi:MAG: Thymidine phosphorylase [Turneriella sp.]|nr:Thymidine phosphorylase [Turneriella sp.]